MLRSIYVTTLLTSLALTTALAGCSGYGYDDGSFTGGNYCDDDCVEAPDPARNQLPPDEPQACDAETEVVLYLSPDDSNSMSSPVQVREAVLSGHGLSGIPVRTWEFLNYYSFDYPAAAPGELSITAELREAGEGKFRLQIGVGSETVSNEDRKPMNITLVLDESGSMSGEPIERLRDVARSIAGSLREGDVISMVTWSTSNNTRLANLAVSGPNDPSVLQAISSITSGGGTDLHGGLVRGYELAQASFDAGRINRIVLISDGGANVGITDADLIAQMAGTEDQEGIYMVGVGVGEFQSYNDALMDTVTDLGKGASVFVPSADEAERLFGERFINTMDVAARDVQVELDLPPGFEIVRFSGEEYSADPSEIEPQHLAPNDAMVFFQEIETCAPELIDADTPLSVRVSWKDPISHMARQVQLDASFGELLEQGSGMIEKGAAILAYAEAAQANDDASWASAAAELALAEQQLPGDADLAEIRAVIDAR